MRPTRTPRDDSKPKNKVVDEAFYQKINIAFKNPRKVCKYCGKEIDLLTGRLERIRIKI